MNVSSTVLDCVSGWGSSDVDGLTVIVRPDDGCVPVGLGSQDGRGAEAAAYVSDRRAGELGASIAGGKTTRPARSLPTSPRSAVGFGEARGFAAPTGASSRPQP